MGIWQICCEQSIPALRCLFAGTVASNSGDSCGDFFGMRENDVLGIIDVIVYIAASLLLGFIIGSAVILILKNKQQKITIQEYEAKIDDLKIQHQQDIKKARDRSLDGSRAVIKGKIAEQLLPVLPEFKYHPSDARFIGDPIDYVIFNGYTEIKDSNSDSSKLEIILLDVKTGKASLTHCQQAISCAIKEGRIRFETIRIGNFKQKAA